MVGLLEKMAMSSIAPFTGRCFKNREIVSGDIKHSNPASVSWIEIKFAFNTVVVISAQYFNIFRL